MASALDDPVGRESEGDASCERGPAREPELPEPGARDASGSDEREQDEDVPAEREAEGAPERPVDEAERQAPRVELPVRLRPERVRVAPGKATVLDVVADEPEPVRRLQVVAGSRLSVAGGAPGQEMRAEVPDCRRCGHEPGNDVEAAGERYKARAARSSSSKSGTSSLAKLQAPCTVPSEPIRKAVRSATSSMPRKECATSKPHTASAFQSESSPKSRSSACAQAMCVHGESREMARGLTPASSNSCLLSRRSSISFVQVEV